MQNYGILDPSDVKDKNDSKQEKKDPTQPTPQENTYKSSLIHTSLNTPNPLLYLNVTTFGFERFLLTVELFRFWLKPKMSTNDLYAMWSMHHIKYTLGLTYQGVPRIKLVVAALVNQSLN